MNGLFEWSKRIGNFLRLFNINSRSVYTDLGGIVRDCVAFHNSGFFGNKWTKAPIAPDSHKSHRVHFYSEWKIKGGWFTYNWTYARCYCWGWQWPISSQEIDQQRWGPGTLVDTGVLNPVHDFRFNPTYGAQTQPDTFGKRGVKAWAWWVIFCEKRAVCKSRHFLDFLHAHNAERALIWKKLVHFELR